MFWEERGERIKTTKKKHGFAGTPIAWDYLFQLSRYVFSVVASAAPSFLSCDPQTRVVSVLRFHNSNYKEFFDENRTDNPRWRHEWRKVFHLRAFLFQECRIQHIYL
jgi:hypothetical protein